MRILSRLERLEDELLPPPPAAPWTIRIDLVDSRRAECYGPDFVREATKTLVFQVDQHREPGWRTGRRYLRTRGVR